MEHDDFGNELWSCWRDLNVAYRTFAKMEAVDEDELYVVDALWKKGGGLTQREICDLCDLNKQTVSATCKRLAADGCISSQQGAVDKRERIITLTDEGHAHWDGPVKRMRKLEHDSAKGIADWEAAVFLKVARQYVKAFEEGLTQ